MPNTFTYPTMKTCRQIKPRHFELVRHRLSPRYSSQVVTSGYLYSKPSVFLMPTYHLNKLSLLNWESLTLHLTPSSLSWEFARSHFLSGSVLGETLTKVSGHVLSGCHVPVVLVDFVRFEGQPASRSTKEGQNSGHLCGRAKTSNNRINNLRLRYGSWQSYQLSQVRNFSAQWEGLEHGRTGS